MSRVTRVNVQLPLQTADLIGGFMVWVILSSLMPYIRLDVAISPEQAALLTAIPLVLGSVLRVPIGYFANLMGARPVFIFCFVVLLVPVWFISEATTYETLLIAGAFLGFGGAIFSVGVTSLPKYYNPDRYGFVNGVYGMGNMGTAFTTWLAPIAAVAFGWQTAVKLYLVLLGVLIVLNIIAGDTREPRVKTPLVAQLRSAGRDGRLWRYSLYYFVTFGTFLALTVTLPMQLTSDYGLDGVAAGLATSLFIIIASVMRPVGGWLADHYNTSRLLIGVYLGISLGTILLAIGHFVGIYLSGVYLIGFACGIGNGMIFKLVPQAFPTQTGIANGVVSMIGGLGGFFPPLALSASTLAFGIQTPALILLVGACVVCIIFIVRKTQTRACVHPQS